MNTYSYRGFENWSHDEHYCLSCRCYECQSYSFCNTIYLPGCSSIRIEKLPIVEIQFIKTKPCSNIENVQNMFCMKFGNRCDMVHSTQFNVIFSMRAESFEDCKNYIDASIQTYESTHGFQ